MKKLSLRNSVIISILIIVTISIVFLIMIPIIVINPMINQHVEFGKIYTAEDFDLNSEDFVLKTPDGINLQCYLVKASQIEGYDLSKGSIIFLSGIHNPSVTAFFGHAEWLRKLGYDCYLLEVRAHGLSSGNQIGLGYTETLDVDTVVQYIIDQGNTIDQAIIIFGLSMGGAIAINSIGLNDKIDGVISLSAYSSFDETFTDIMHIMGAPKFYTVIQKPFVKFYTTFKFGYTNAHKRPVEQIKNLRNRPALLLHSTEDDQVPYSNFIRLTKNMSENMHTYTKQGNHHFILEYKDFLNPTNDTEYKELIENFLNKYFVNKPY